MKPTLKTKQQLIEEMDAMRRRMAEVEAFAAQRKLAEEALRESEKHYSTLVGSLTDAIFELRGKTITWCNDRVKDLYGYTREELIGKNPSFLFPPDIIRSEFRKRISTAINEKGFFRDIAKVMKKGWRYSRCRVLYLADTRG